MVAGSLELQLLANIARLQKDMDEAKRVVGGAMSQIERMAAGAGKAIGAIAGGVTAAAFVALVRGAIDAADGLNKLSQRTGIAVESLSQLRYAAKLADVSNESLNNAIRKLNVSIAAGLGGDKEKIALFKQLGITTKDLGAGTESVMLKMADAYSKARDGAGKVAVGNALMGKTADEMIPFLNAGGAAIRDLMKEADRLGLTIGADFAAKAEEFNDNITRLSTGSQKLAIILAGDLIESLGNAAKAMAEASIEGGKLAGVWAGLETLITGTDRHKNNVQLVQLTEKLMAAEDRMDKLRSGRAAKETLDVQASLIKGLKEQIGTTQAYRQALDQQDASAQAAADKIKKLREAGKELKDVGGGGGKAKPTEAEIQAQKDLAYHVEFTRKAFLARHDDAIKQAEEQAKARTAAAESEAKATQELIEEIDALNKARGDSWNDLVRQQYEQRRALEDSNAELELEARLIGTTDRERKTAIETLRIEQQLRKDIEAIKARGLGGGMTEKAIADATANAEEAKRQAGTRAGLEEQIGLLQRMDDVARDTFVSIFESGKSAFDRLKDTLKNGLYALLYEMTVRKWVLSIGAGVTGGAASAGTSAAGSAGGSMVGSALGSIFGAGGLSGSMMAGAGWLTGASTLGGSLTAATSLMATGTGAGIASGLGMMMGTLGPIALGIAAIMSFIKEGGGPKSDGYSGTLFSSITDTARANGSNPLGDSAKSMVDGITAQFDAIAGLFGVAGKTQFGVGYTVDPKGDAPTFLEVAASQNGQQVFSQPNWNVGREDADLQKAFADAIPQAMFAALKASDLSAPFRAYFDSIADDSTSEVKSAALQTAQDVQKLTVTMQQLGLPFAAFDSLAVTARANLIQLAGGLDATVTSLGAFSEAYFTEQERNAATMAAISKVAEDLGLILPTTDKAFRALVLSQDLTTEAGQKAAAALLQVAQAFDQVTTATQTATRNALQELADSMKGFRDAATAADAGVTDARDRIFDGYTAAQGRLNALLEQSRQATLAFGSTLREYLASLSIGQFATENPAGQYQALQRRLIETAALAQGGNQGARDGLTAAANAFLESSQARSRTAVDLAMDRAAVRTLLEGVMATLPGVGAGAAGPTLEEQIVAAQAELAQWAEVAAQTGVSTEQATLTVADNIAQLKAAYDAATVEQTLANARLDVALAALTSLGLTEELLAAILGGNAGAAPGDFATALGVSEETINAIASAMGFTPDELAALSAALNVTVAPAIYEALGTALGMPAPLVEQMASALGVSPVQMMALQSALNLSPETGMALSVILGTSQEERAALAIALGVNPAVFAPLGVALGFDPMVTTILGTSLGLVSGLTDYLPGSLGLSSGALQAINSLVSATTERSANVALVEQAYASIGRTGYGSGVSQIDSAGFSYWLNALQSGSVSGAGLSSALQQSAFQSLMADPTTALSQYVGPYLRDLGLFGTPSAMNGTDQSYNQFIASQSGIPGLATGTNYLPQDMLFYGHEGEAVVPKQYNPAAAGMNTTVLEGKVDALSKEFKSFKETLFKVEDNTKNVSDTADGIKAGTVIQKVRVVS